MRKLNVAVLLTALLQVPGVFGAELPGAVTCNQMGREIALRAAEELSVPLDAAIRSELAVIAESTCVSYLPTAEDYAAAEAAETEEQLNSSTADVSAAAESGAAEADSERRLFDIEVIDFEDRVRRPGLKRR